MRRNWYAAAILLVLALTLFGCKCYVSATADELEQQVRQAYALTLQQNYTQAQQDFYTAGENARQAGKGLGLLVRRTALERINETLAVLPQYANPNNQADLAVETARACAQIRQMELSFLGTF